MNFFSTIISINRISDYLPNVTAQDMVNYSTRNMSHYMQCLNNRISATTSQILNVVCEGGSWANLTTRDVKILDILQNHMENVLNVFNSTKGYLFEYCADIEILPTENLTNSICKLPLSYKSTSFINPLQYCLQVMMNKTKLCGDSDCFDYHVLADPTCTTNCFTTENITLYELEELCPNGNQSEFFYNIMKKATFSNWVDGHVINNLNHIFQRGWWFGYKYPPLAPTSSPQESEGGNVNETIVSFIFAAGAVIVICGIGVFLLKNKLKQRAQLALARRMPQIRTEPEASESRLSFSSASADEFLLNNSN